MLTALDWPLITPYFCIVQEEDVPSFWISIGRVCNNTSMQIWQSYDVYTVLQYMYSSNQIKSNQILFKVRNVHLKEKKINKKLFTGLAFTQQLHVHSEKILLYYSCIAGCLVAQITVAEIWSNAWLFYSHISHHIMCNRRPIHTMTVELLYQLHSKLLPVICTVK